MFKFTKKLAIFSAFVLLFSAVEAKSDNGKKVYKEKKIKENNSHNKHKKPGLMKKPASPGGYQPDMGVIPEFNRPASPGGYQPDMGVVPEFNRPASPGGWLPNIGV